MKTDPLAIRRSDNHRNADQLRAMRRPENDRIATADALRARQDFAIKVSASLAIVNEMVADRTCRALFSRLGVRSVA